MNRSQDKEYVDKLQTNIQNMYFQKVKDLGATIDNLSSVTGEDVRLVKRWESRDRTIRLYNWKAVTSHYNIKTPELDKLLIEHDSYLRSLFIEMEKTYKNLIRSVVQRRYYKFKRVVEIGDLMQEVWLHVWRGLDAYDVSVSPVPWLYISIRSACSRLSKWYFDTEKRGTFGDTLSLDYCYSNKSGDEENATLLDILADDSYNIFDSLEEDELVTGFFEKYISDREMDILEKRFFMGHTLVEVGESCGISRERVRQIEERAINKIRAGLIEKFKRGFVHGLD